MEKGINWNKGKKWMAAMLAITLTGGEVLFAGGCLTAKAEAAEASGAQFQEWPVETGTETELPDELSGFVGAQSVQDLSAYEDSEAILVYSCAELAESAVSQQQAAGISGTVELVDNTTVLFKVSDKSELEAAFSSFEKNGDILYYQPNYRYEVTAAPSDPYFANQWGLSNNGTFSAPYDYADYRSVTAANDVDMNVPEAWDVLRKKQEETQTEKEVVVAVIDTGIDINHEDLQGVIWTNQDEVTNGVDSDGNGYTDDIHGWNFYSRESNVYNNPRDDEHATHIAGIIAAAQNSIGVAGVASEANVKIMPVKCLGGRDGSGNLADILKGISYAEENGADICNMSFGMEGNRDSEENKVFTEAIAKSDMLFVTASGNGDTKGIGFDITNRQMYPACCQQDNLLAVANILWSGYLDVSSNYSASYVDVAAPGMAIYSTAPSNQYEYLSGTSMAAPMVSGVAALIMAYYDRAVASDVKKIIDLTAKKLSSLSGKTITGGIPDAYAALTSSEAAEIAKKSAPVISLGESYESADSYVKNLVIQVTDADNDLESVRCETGVQDLAYFAGGTMGSEVPGDGSSAGKSLPFWESTTYTVYAKDKSGYEVIQTYDLKIKQVVLAKEEKTVKKGKTYQIKASLNTGETGTYTYTSSNPQIASVNAQGAVKGKKKGRSIITVTTPNGKEAVCLITVKKKKA